MLEIGKIQARSEMALAMAEELRETLGNDHPSFVKQLIHAHVTGGFWLGLPPRFCQDHLPNHDQELVLVDEAGDETPVLYLAAKRGLSCGWRRFALEHGLVDGDCLVFQLFQPAEFKVYIIRRM